MLELPWVLYSSIFRSDISFGETKCNIGCVKSYESYSYSVMILPHVIYTDVQNK